jgi:hypothetical protein
MGLLWLLTSATWGEVILAEGLHDSGRRGHASFETYRGICLTSEEKHTDTIHCINLAVFLGTVLAGLLSISSLSCLWVISVSTSAF